MLLFKENKGENFRFVSLASVFVSKIKRAHFARFTREKEEEDKEKTKEQHETRISFTSVRIAQHATQQASHGRRRHRHALFRLLLLLCLSICPPPSCSLSARATCAEKAFFEEGLPNPPPPLKIELKALLPPHVREDDDRNNNKPPPLPPCSAIWDSENGESKDRVNAMIVVVCVLGVC